MRTSVEMTARTGMHVMVELLDAGGAGERLECDIVPDAAADLVRGFLGEGTPLGRAIRDARAGSLVAYRQADIVRVRVISVEPARSSPGRAAAQKEEVIRKAVEEAERTNAILFASSFSGKWGDYDPEGMEHWEEEERAK
jgi:hypothetical protein